MCHSNRLYLLSPHAFDGVEETDGKLPHSLGLPQIWVFDLGPGPARLAAMRGGARKRKSSSEWVYDQCRS